MSKKSRHQPEYGLTGCSPSCDVNSVRPPIKMSKAREFWIFVNGSSNEREVFHEDPRSWYPTTEGQIVHVIEYEAIRKEFGPNTRWREKYYDKVDELVVAEKEIDRLRKCLK